ncbi:3-hydroxyacyl-CoA dehydrogenase [Parablautia muri]|uniref:3-hydroxyacyl-CoA dehydrogenase n=1 Tax=Parablautia muri TaxID=2320879 RepID=A0A9X5GRH6_9FIRM|nr:3-hydroxyacyl-CoA dehydrogenase [Parablautia muri]NBJ93233.1 3-hydroxyacyl-CoA dehydrogenase [Parablautia muri]
MRRFNPPYNGHRFLLNKNTGEIHDLDRETAYCRINDINPGHIYTSDSYLSCLIYAKAEHCPNPNGCFYCQPEKDKG